MAGSKPKEEGEISQYGDTVMKIVMAGYEPDMEVRISWGGLFKR